MEDEKILTALNDLRDRIYKSLDGVYPQEFLNMTFELSALSGYVEHLHPNREELKALENVRKAYTLLVVHSIEYVEVGGIFCLKWKVREQHDVKPLI